MKTVIDAVNEFKGEQPEAMITRTLWGYARDKPLGTATGYMYDKVQICTIEEYEQCVEDCSNNVGKAKPVYTQAMADNGELPSVGMECCYSTSSAVVWNKCTVIAYYDGFVWTSDNGVRPLANTRFKPLTPPKTDKEKAFDKFLDINYNSTRDEFLKSESDRDFIEGLELAFNAGIQLLEVKS